MSMIAPFEPNRFSSTVAFYQRHRLRYPARLIHRIAEETPLGPKARVLDLGCGPGFIAIALAPYAETVIGIDPDVAMLAAARAEAAAADAAVEWREGASNALPDDLGPLDLVTMGRSFHWMDRHETLARLDELVAPAGLLALLGDSRPKCPANRWVDAFDRVTGEFRPPNAFEDFRRSEVYEPHFSVLLRSPFGLVERIHLLEERETSIDDQVGRALSRSSTAPQVLQDRQGAFEAALRAALAPFADKAGAITEIVEYTALLARRP